MPGQRVEMIERMLDAWNRRDVDGMIALAHAEIEYVNPPRAIEPGTRRGHEGLEIVVRKQWEGLGDARQQVERVHERDDDIVTENRVVRTLPGSDAPLDNRTVIRWTFRDGKISRVAVLGAGSGFDAGLAEAGISPSDKPEA